MTATSPQACVTAAHWWSSSSWPETLGVISNNKLTARTHPYFGTFFETSVFALEFAWRATQMNVDGTSKWESRSDRITHNEKVAYMCFPECPALQRES